MGGGQPERTTCRLIAVMIASTRQDKTNPYMRQEIGTVPCLAKEVLAIDGCCKRKSQFSLRVGSLVGWPGSNGWPHSHAYVSSTY